MKWVEAVALPTKEAPGVANALIRYCNNNCFVITIRHILCGILRFL